MNNDINNLQADQADAESNEARLAIADKALRAIASAHGGAQALVEIAKLALIEMGRF